MPKDEGSTRSTKTQCIRNYEGKQEIFHWVHRYLSSLTNLVLKLDDTESETTSEAGCALIEPMDNKVKWNQKSTITVLKLEFCDSFFGSGALEPLDYFVHLEKLEINRCDVLVQWPEKVFQSLVSLRSLTISECSNLTGCAQAPPEPPAYESSQQLPALEFIELTYCESVVRMFNLSASLKNMTIHCCNKLESIFGRQQQGMSELVQGSSCSEAILPTAVSPMNHFFPCLEYLWLNGCDSLSTVLHLPSSLKILSIGCCRSIQVLTCQLDGLPKPEPSAAEREHSLPPCLVHLIIISCADMLGGIFRLPTSLKELTIAKISGLTSLEFLSGEPPSLRNLCLESCSTLASLSNEPQAYGSLKELTTTGCPAIKRLPRYLQQQLGSIRGKGLDARYEVMAFKPMTWREIPRLVREQRQANRN